MSLVVSGQEANSVSWLIESQLVDSEVISSSEGVGIYSGPGWATLTVDERHSEGADGQAAELVRILSPRKPALDALREAGKAVKVDVAGVTESGSGLYISPDVLAGLAELGVPVTFTTVRESGEDEEDPLAWLG
ncbi:hypothetical protein D9753_16350 [Streptomyces dangxiongensis]|uniref:DUF4279 domain-containing protein n=1 Tax=Streptomyces dangxiongensis TaxID=1442032 RepID=A0A3G2JD20_9ACTN|nr:hypothetical protein [Streptomyces dangxiongensis]AYN40226.1 hypothetical protein D9753_16350 [Streptomyces dangxiongensis]